MKFQRKNNESSRLIIPLKFLAAGFMLFLVIVYVISFLAVINNNKKEQQKLLRGAGIRDGITIQHDIYDTESVERFGRNDHNNERANVSIQQQQQKQQLLKASATVTTTTIGWAITITGCGSDPITEGAAVLKHSIHLASMHGPMNGRYDYKLYCLYHPDAFKCAKTLESLGYELIERNTPVAVKDIQGGYLKSKIHQNGCCGEKELVKLEAYTLTQHPIVVHMDLDTLVMKPLDNLFDWMLSKTDDGTSEVPVMWTDEPKPKRVNAMFTRDYNMGGKKKKQNRSVQGGFLVLRPDQNVYNEFVEIIRKGDFREGGGWGGKTGVFYGSMTFQGIVPYYYDFLHPGEAVELNRCIINQMADNPRNKRTVNDVVNGNCMTGETDCEDCRSRPVEEILTVHFTLCQKPWLCLPEDSDIIQQRLCRKLHHNWHRIRSELEQSWGRPEIGQGEYQTEHFYGHCKTHSQKGYIYIKEPFGIP